MTITINGDLVLDEQAGVQSSSNLTDSDDDDLSWSSFQTALTASLYNHLFTAAGLNLPTNTSGAATFPQVATQSGLISLSTPVNDLTLVRDSAGDAFNGVDSGWTDLAGNHIFLYADSSNHVVLGRAGTGSTANPNGAIDMAIVLDDHLTSGLVTSADLYLLQFTALKEPIAGAVDDADVLDLTNKVYLAQTTSSTVEFNDFTKVPSGSDNWTIIQPSAGGTDPDILVTAMTATEAVEVSTQGLGEGSQAINQGEGLRFDFVNGGAGGAGPSPAALTNPEVHDDTQIAYTAHQLGTGGGFQITQVNPGSSSTTVTAKIYAYDAAGDYQGADFKAHVGDETAVNITSGSVVVTNASGTVVTTGITVDYTGDTVVIGGLKTGYHVAFTTDGSMDRFVVQNVTSQSNRSFDVADIKFQITTVTGSSAEVGSHLKTEDDGPTITAQTNTGATVVHDETPGVQTGDSNGTDIAFGAATIASLFTNVPSPGDDLDVTGTGPIGYAASTASLVTVTGGSAGADGPASTELTYALQVTDGTDSGLATTAGTEIYLYNGTGSAAGLVLGRVGTGSAADPNGTTAFALADDPTTGKVFVAQYLSLHHNDAALPNDQVNLAAGSLFMSVTRTDGDGDTATDSNNDISLQVGFKDDAPAITAATNTGASVTHDETPGVQTGDSNGADIAYGAVTIASLFTNVPSPGDDPDVTGTGAIGFAASSAGLVTVTNANYGADGQGATPLTYALSVTDGTDSGVTTTGGAHIFLYNGTGAAAGLVLGRVGTSQGAADPNGTTAFALADDPSTGKVFVAQYLSLHHNNPNDANDLVNLAAGSLFMAVTITDGDGDTATDSNNDISLQVGFRDDGPSITAQANANATVVHDETPGVQADTDSAGSTIAYGTTTIASVFTNVPSPGDDPDVTGSGPIGFAASTLSMVTVTGGSDGADGPAATELTYAISVTNGTDSGLTTTSGTHIFLYNGTGSAAGLVLGRVGTAAGAADPNGTTAFAFADDPTSGKLFVAQYLSLHNGDATKPDDQVNLAAGSLFMSVTRTDGDGDSATASGNDISQQVGFQDDGPTISTTLQGGNVAFAKNAFLTESTGAVPGADGATVTIDATTIVLPTGFTDTLSLDGQHMTVFDASHTAIYQLDVTATNYTFTVLQDEPPAFTPLNFAAIPSGSPTETLTVNATGTTTNITFDGVDFTGTAAIGSALDGSVLNPGPASTVDDLNPDSVGFGEKGGQASQMNQNEGFLVYDAAHAAMEGLKFDIAGVGGVKNVQVEWWMMDSSNNVVNYGLDSVDLPSGSATITETILDNPNTFDHMYVRFFYLSNASNAGVRVENFQTEIPNNIPNREVDFGLKITDGDGDVALSNSVGLHIVA